MWRRRAFLQQLGFGLGLAFAFPAAGIPPFSRTGPARLKLGLAAYSFRDDFQHADPARRLDFFKFLDYCADHHCEGAELTSYYFPDGVTPELLLKVKRHAFLRGVDISGTSVGNTFALPPGTRRQQQIQYVKRWIDHAALLGAPHLRIFAGEAEGLSHEEAKAQCLAALEECCAHAAGQGVFLGIENHGGIVARTSELLDIVRKVESPWIGINLDTGNFNSPDPYEDIRLCAPYAVNVQLKTELRVRGRKQQADLPRILSLLREARYQGYVTLEYEAAEDPWKAVPGILETLRTHMAQPQSARAE